MLRDESLLILSLPTDGFAISAIIVCEVTTLAQSFTIFSQSVKAGTFLMKSFLPSAQSMKVFCCLCNLVYKQLEKDMVQGLITHSVIKENSGVDWLGGGSVCKAKLSSFFSANCLSSWKGTSFAF